MREFKWPSERICLEVASKVDWKGEKAGTGIEGAVAASRWGSGDGGSANRKERSF